MGKHIIKYSGFFSFLIWFFPKQYKEKEVALNILEDVAIFKSDIYSGVAKKVNKNIAFIAKYGFVLILLLLISPEKTRESWLFEFSLLIGFFIPFFFLKIPFLKIDQFILSLATLGVITAISLAAYLVNDFYFTVKALAFSAHSGIFFLLLFKSIIDFVDNSNKTLYCICEKRILFYV
ncbi:MAG: hypothetical protein QG567_2149 [Campylobacterota bacterium]|nr:hypothetical protein [Campylobacterota bacterium]